MENTIITRIVQKHDLEAIWNSLLPEFIPMQGEFIVYDSEVSAEGTTLQLPEGRTAPYTYERFKIGDGVTPLIDLPFLDEKMVLSASQIISGEKSLEDVVQALPPIEKGLSDRTISQIGAIAGTLGYYYSYIDLENKKIYLSTHQAIPQIGTQDMTDEFFETPEYLAENRICLVNGSKYDHGVGTCTAKVESVYKNVVTYTGDIGFTSIYEVSEIDTDDYTFFTIESPHIGAVEVRAGGVAFGEGAKALGTDAVALGYASEAVGNYSTAMGINTYAGYAATAKGRNTKATGKYAETSGRDTVASADYSFAEGYRTEASGTYSHAGGLSSKALKSASVAMGNNVVANKNSQAVFGQYNIKDEEEKYAFILGWGYANTPKNILTVDTAGNTEISGNLVAKDLNIKNGSFDGNVTAKKVTATSINVSQDATVNTLYGTTGIFTQAVTSRGKELATKEYVDGSVQKKSAVTYGGKQVETFNADEVLSAFASTDSVSKLEQTLTELQTEVSTNATEFAENLEDVSVRLDAFTDEVLLLDAEVADIDTQIRSKASGLALDSAIRRISKFDNLDLAFSKTFNAAEEVLPADIEPLIKINCIEGPTKVSKIECAEDSGVVDQFIIPLNVLDMEEYGDYCAPDISNQLMLSDDSAVIVKHVNKKVFVGDASEKWSWTVNETYGPYASIHVTDRDKEKGHTYGLLSDYCPIGLPANIGTPCMYFTGDSLVIYPKSEIQSKDEWLEYLRTANETGAPFTIRYKLAQHSKIDVTPYFNSLGYLTASGGAKLIVETTDNQVAKIDYSGQGAHIATREFVKDEIDHLKGSAPKVYDTLEKIAIELEKDNSAEVAIINELNDTSETATAALDMATALETTKEDKYVHKSKNLFDASKVFDSYETLVSEEPGCVQLKSTNANTARTELMFREICPKTEVGKTYTLTYDVQCDSEQYYNSGSITPSGTFLLTENIYNSSILFEGAWLNDNHGAGGGQPSGEWFSNIMLVEGKTSLRYEPFGSSKDLEETIETFIVPEISNSYTKSETDKIFVKQGHIYEHQLTLSTYTTSTEYGDSRVTIVILNNSPSSINFTNLETFGTEEFVATGFAEGLFVDRVKLSYNCITLSGFRLSGGNNPEYSSITYEDEQYYNWYVRNDNCKQLDI